VIGAVGASGAGIMYLNNRILDAEYAALQSQYIELLDQYESTESNYSDICDEIDYLLGEYDTLNKTYLDLLDTYDSLVANCSTLIETLTILSNETHELNETYQELLVEFDILNQSYWEFREEYDVLNCTYFNLHTNYTQLESDFSVLESNYTFLQSQYDTLQTQYNELQTQLQDLNTTYLSLNTSYWDMYDDYTFMQSQYGSMVNQYESLNTTYHTLCTWIGQQIYPLQICNFAEAVRRYYLDDYLGDSVYDNGDLNLTKYWYNFTKFMGHIVYHSSSGYYFSEDEYTTNPTDDIYFDEVAWAFRDAIDWDEFPVNLTEAITLRIQRRIFGYYGSWMDPTWWNGTHTLELLWGERRSSHVQNKWQCPSAIHQWVYNHIDYEYDSDITRYRNYTPYDYIKFPVETAFRTMGDCDDQAILDAAYLRSCGFQVATCVFHDDDHPTQGSFCHAVLFINCDFNENGVIDSDENPSGSQLWWCLNGTDYTWLCLDPTWDVAFQSTPSWLQDYDDYGITDFSGRMSYYILSKPPVV
jgi:predicted nuclease with TOPRIM domain